MNHYDTFSQFVVVLVGLATGGSLLAAALRLLGRAPGMIQKILCCVAATLVISGIVTLVCEITRWLLSQLPAVLLLIFVLLCLPIFRHRRW
jgi:Ni/Fe-hydrogenase subunit HybB-like protein